MASNRKRPRQHQDSRDVPMRPWTILAQDPRVRHRNGNAMTTVVMVPAESLESGPRGHRVQVVDFDASTDTFYRAKPGDPQDDPYRKITDIERLVRDPHFHQQNVYAIVMATLGEFEAALGRPVPWGFGGLSHQIKAAPHAFADSNAFYSRRAESLSFGYFEGRRGKVFTCLSHDIVAHETAHALLDGLRSYYTHPSSADQAGFHEGFADVVALLSVLKSPELVAHSLAHVSDRRNQIAAGALTFKKIAENVLLKLAEEFGEELTRVRGRALRESMEIVPSKRYFDLPEYEEPHRRGELLVAPIMRAFVRVWLRRLGPLGLDEKRSLNRAVVAEEGSTAAGQLLRVAIRALDYLPPVDMKFADFLSALLTADAEVYPDDHRFEYRRQLREEFAAFGIAPASDRTRDGTWERCEGDFTYAGTHFEQMRSEPNSVFRFIWENRKALAIERSAFTRVTSIRPCLRIGNDRFFLRETVVEYVQSLRVFGNELGAFGLKLPKSVSGRAPITLHGGGTLIFDEYGRLKFHIHTNIGGSRQNDQLAYLAARGDLMRDSRAAQADFAKIHFERGIDSIRESSEEW